MARKTTRSSWVIVCLILSLLAFWLNRFYQEQDTTGPRPFPETGSLKVHFIDVGQGDAILVQTPAGRNMLVDAGDTDCYPDLAAYLRRAGVAKLDLIIGSHPHEDHLGSMDQIIANFEVGEFYLPKVPSNSRFFADLLRAVKEKGLKIKTAKEGIALELEPAVGITMLAPQADHYEDLNNYSVVVKVSYGRTACLLTGDAEALSERELLESGLDLRADLLKVGHHGSRSSTTEAFLRAVSPEYAVISVGAGNRYRHPAPAVLDELIRQNVTIYRTDENGNILFSSDGQNFQVEAVGKNS